tara:strand:- start:1544 stop:2374 length:831 start_codon:yes stop_codon:yes gene_type:complete
MNDFINDKINKLIINKIHNPEVDLRVLLNFCSRVSNQIILSNFNSNQINLKKFNKLFKRRLTNEPISKIINKKNFWKDEFYVNQFVLDPRPETEGIIEESLFFIKNKKEKIKILDIGTGSGAIAISLAREFINAKIIAIDISGHALNVAKKNITKKKYSRKIKLKKTTINKINEKFDLIVSNPPYLSFDELKCIPFEIKNFEPTIALNGGKDGLKLYRQFADKIPKIMKPSSFFVCEIGHKQFKKCKEIFKDSGLKFEKKSVDLQKKDRIMVFSKL